jgi:hypothetical protein
MGEKYSVGSHFEKHFTLDEANTLLPWIQSIFGEVHQILHEIVAETPEDIHYSGPGAQNGRDDSHKPILLPPLDPLADEPNPESSTMGGHGGHQWPWTGLTSQEKLTLVNQLLQAFVDRGIVIQDIERGLIDFPAWRAGEEVLLCYELGDGPRIGFWHDLEAGYPGRQPIEDWPEGKDEG